MNLDSVSLSRIPVHAACIKVFDTGGYRCVEVSYSIHVMSHLKNQAPFFKIQKDEVGGTCGTHGGWERCLQGFGWEAQR
jgi:hypothetical protein